MQTNKFAISKEPLRFAKQAKKARNDEPMHSLLTWCS